MHSWFHNKLTIDDSKEIFAMVQRLLVDAAKAEKKQTVRAISFPPSFHSVSLYKVVAKLVSRFRTQAIGGFETQERLSREEVYASFRDEIQSFPGLICGIEAPRASCITDVAQFDDRLQHQEAVVYQNQGTLSSALVLPFSGYPGQKITIHGYRAQPSSKRVVYLAHSSSGTSEIEKYPHNRSAFLQLLSGDISLDGMVYRPQHDISFWDVNFDITNSAMIPKAAGPSSLEMLLSFTQSNPIQLVFPCVRVRKKRIANRPFANNQIHKGGITQLAESMIAVFPNDLDITAMDDDGLFILKEGMIWMSRPHGVVTNIPHIDAMEWKEYHAFSQQVCLDHKPICVFAGKKGYQFHNFMDFQGARGIGPGWYDSKKLQAADILFWNWLCSRFTA